MTLNSLSFWFFCIFIFLIGACFGSFFKLIVDRYCYKIQESFIFKPSYCVSCKNTLKWWQNIPILSYLLLGGNCFYCKSKIDIKNLFSELICAFVALSVFISSSIKKLDTFEILMFELFFMILILLTFFDLKHRIIPHIITYSTIILIIITNWLIHHSLISSFLSLGIIFIFMDFLYVFMSTIKKIKTDINHISTPLLIWLICFYFQDNLLFILFSIAAYWGFLKLNISYKIHLLSWLVLFLTLVFHLYKIVLLEFNSDKLVLLFAGIGIIYFICEVLSFYLCGFFLQKTLVNAQNTTDSEKVVLGGGDITVLALISVFLGYKVVFLTLFLASLFAIISQFILKAINYLLKKPSISFSQYLPFVPFISLACFIIILAKW